MTLCNIAFYCLALGLYGLASAGPVAVAVASPIPLDMGRVYTRDEVDLLAAGIAVPRWETSVNSAFEARRDLESRTAIVSTAVAVNSVWTCPSYGIGLSVSMRFLMALQSDTTTVTFTGTFNVDSFLQQTATGYADYQAHSDWNTASYEFCLSYGTKICSYKWDQGFYATADQRFTPTTLSADFVGSTGDVNSYGELTEYCITLISGGACPTVQASQSFCTATSFDNSQSAA